MALGDVRSQYQKLLAPARAIITCDNINLPCEIIDISLNGCLLRFKTTWEQHNIEAIYTLTIHPPEDTPIIINLSIKHVIDNEVGFKCEHIDRHNSTLLHQLVGSGFNIKQLLARDLSELTHSV